MAILYGTTPEGQTFPVQVNEFGQLVCKGLPGEQGEQGEQGPIGPPGDFQFTSGAFVPVFASTSDSAAGIFDYAAQDGYWYRFGPLVTIQVYLVTNSVTLTDARGDVLVSGFPPEAALSTPSPASVFGPFSLNYLQTEQRGRFTGGRVKYDPVRNACYFYAGYEGPITNVLYSHLDGSTSTNNIFAFTFSGLAADSVQSVSLPLDDLV